MFSQSSLQRLQIMLKFANTTLCSCNLFSSISNDPIQSLYFLTQKGHFILILWQSSCSFTSFSQFFIQLFILCNSLSIPSIQICQLFNFTPKNTVQSLHFIWNLVNSWLILLHSPCILLILLRNNPKSACGFLSNLVCLSQLHHSSPLPLVLNRQRTALFFQRWNYFLAVLMQNLVKSLNLVAQNHHLILNLWNSAICIW